MGKRALKNKKKSKLKNNHSTNKSVISDNIANDSEEKKVFSVDELLEKTEDFIDSFEFETAGKFCERALEQEPNNVKCVETMGVLLMETDRIDEAKKKFEKAIEIEPDKGHSKYMNLGQLCTGLQSINYFKKGLEIMQNIITQDQTNEKKPVTAKNLSNGYCSVAELYMTDACFEENAQDECSSHLSKAIEADETNAEAFHLSSNYFLTIGEFDKAKELIEKGIALWLPEMESGRETEGASSEDPIYVCSLSYIARINATKILIELAMFEKAIDILELLLDEEDEVVDVWYLLGLINIVKDDPDFINNARYYLGKAVKVINKCGCDDTQMVEHIAELQQQVGGAIESDNEENTDISEVESDSDEEMEEQ